MQVRWRLFTLLATASLFVSVSSHKCHRNIETMWLFEAGSSPVVSSPLLADINGDNTMDVAVCTFDGQVSVLDSSTGHELPGWPITALGHNFHAAPLLYDIDKDGLMEILLSTSDGIIMFLKSDGTPIPQQILKVPPLKLKKDWFVVTMEQLEKSNFNVVEPRLAAQFADHSEFVTKKSSEKREGVEDNIWSVYTLVSPPSGLSKDESQVYVDAHILSTPVITDFNHDGLENELIVSVNFYFDQKRVSLHPKHSSLSAQDLENYLGSGIVVFNLDTREIIYKKVLEVTKRSSQYPGYVFSSPTILDNTSVVIGTSAGNIFVVNSSKHDAEILSSMDSIQGQISVADANDDGHLELLTVDDSGNVACIDHLTGKRVWESRVSGSASPGMRVADIDGDGLLDIVFATYDGYVWVLNGETGKVLSGWPIKLPGEIRATILVTKLKPGTDSGLDLVIPLLDGMLAIIRGSDHCTEFIDIGITAFSSAVTANILPWKKGLELVVGGAEGSVLCLGDISNISTLERSSDFDYENLLSWPSETLPCTGTTFYSGKVGVTFTKTTKKTTHYRGSSFPIEFEITDLQEKDLRWNDYRTKIFIGNKLLAVNKTIYSGGVYQEHIPVPFLPGKFVIIIKVITPNNQCFKDSFHVSFNTHQLEDIHWYLLAPFLTMFCLLLVLHGNTPPSEVLPTIFRKHSR